MTHNAVENMCSQGWTSDQDLGWFQTNADAGCGEAGWRSFTAEYGTYHCCMDFAGTPLPTDAPADSQAPSAMVTDAPVDTEAPADSQAPSAMVTEAPDNADKMPFSRDPPTGCVSMTFFPEGFQEVSYCESDGMVYMEGYSTCIPSSSNDLEVALQNSWDNDWFFGTSQDCTERDSDETTDNQLWVTNKMCDNLEQEIDSVETGLDSYMDIWRQDVTTLVNQNMDKFDQDTQQALTDYLNALNGN